MNLIDKKINDACAIYYDECDVYMIYCDMCDSFRLLFYMQF